MARPSRDVGIRVCCLYKEPYDRDGPFTCPMCGLIIGWPCKPEPSNDTAPGVAVEILAAEMARLADENPKRFKREHSTVTSDVGRGWWVHQMDLVAADVVTEVADGLAGYLARCIATHSEAE